MANQLWQKRVLIPFWTIQLIFVVILLVLFSFSVALVRDYQDNYADYDGTDRISRPVYRAFNAVAAVYIGLCALTIIFDITEIILLARNQLSPKLVVAFSAIITLVWAVILILQIIGSVGGATGSALGFIFIIVVFATALGQLIYSSVILHRYRKGRFASRGTYSTAATAPANAEAGVVGSGTYTAYNPALQAPLNPFRDNSRNPSPAAVGHSSSGAAGEYYNTAPSYEMQQSAIR